MTEPIPLNLAVEDELSENVIRAVLQQCAKRFDVGTCYRKRGFVYLKRTIRGFNNAAKGTPFLVLTDLDQYECPPRLTQKWLPEPKHPNLLFRVAVREVEAWLMADRAALSKFLGVRRDLIPQDVESINDPKEFLVGLARRSRSREIRDALVPRSGSTAIIGRDYNGKLSEFVNDHWQVEVAQQCSDSLRRAVQVLTTFQPEYSKPTPSRGSC